MSLEIRLVFVITLISGCILSFAYCGFAQPSGKSASISGTITLGEEHILAPGVHIMLTGTKRGASTDMRGMYKIEDLPEGRYEVVVSYTGYHRVKMQVAVTEGQSTDLSLNLVEAPFLLNEVVVTGSLNKHLLKDTPVITEVISQKDLTTIGSSDLADVMRSQTGIEISTGIGQTQSAQLHGLSDNHVLILVDGERTTGKVDGAVDLGQIPLESIEKIEIVKGPLSSIYGSEAIGGVVNIITKDPGAASHLTLASTFGTYGRQDYELTAANTFANPFGDNSAVKLFLNSGWNKFFGVDYNPNDNFMEMPERDRKSFGIKSIFQFSKYASVRVNGDYYKDQSEWLAGSPALYLNDKGTNEKVTGNVSGQYRFTPSTEATATMHYSRNDHTSTEQSISGFYIRDDASQEKIQTYRLQMSTIPYNTSLLTFGFEYNQEAAVSSRISGHEKQYITNVAYAEDEWAFSPLVVTLGGRYSNNSVYGRFFSPRLSMLYKVSDHLTLRGSYGRGFRAPSINELFIDFANNGVGYTVQGEPALQPETSNGYNFGLQYARDDLVWFRINAYYNQLHNLIDYYVKSKANEPIILSYWNIAEAVTKGIDVDVDINPIEDVSLGAGYAYTVAQDGQGNDLPFRSPHMVNWHAQYSFTAYEAYVSLRGRWFDKKRVTDEQVNLSIYNSGGSATFFNTPAQMLIDLKIAKRIFTQFEFSAGINNIFDKTYYPFGQIKGREYFAGINFTMR